MYSGKNAIITGGSSGIGAELAKRLHGLGANVALVARDAAKLEKVRAGLHAGRGGKVGIFPCDVTDYAAAEAVIQRIVETFGPPDFLFNFAGILSSGYFEELPVEDFRRVMETNFFGLLNTTKAALPYFKAKRGGHIVNMSSVSGLMGVFGYSSYCASKFAVTGLTESLRTELKPQGITMHLVMPTEIDTPMMEGVKDVRPPENVKLAHTAGVLSAAEAVDAIVDGVSKGRFIIIPGAKPQLLVLAMKLMPSLSRFFIDSMVKANYSGPSSRTKKT